MATTSKSEYQWLVKKVNVDACEGWTSPELHRVEMVKLTTYRQDTTRRPLPEDLLAAMTDRDHWRELWKYGLQTRTFETRAYCLATNRWMPFTQLYEKKMSYNQFDWPTANPDWGEAMRNKIRSRVVSYAETIGEYRDSISMLHSGTSLLRRCWRLAKALWRNRRNRRALIRILKSNGRWLVKGRDERFEFYDLVSADLAIKFGILPLAGLLEDSLMQASLNRARGFRCQVTVPASAEKVVSNYIYGTGTTHHRVERSVRAIAYVRMKDTAGDYTAGSLPEALWAGTRLSFMVDWFFNVSSYLSALDAMREVESVRGCTVTKTRYSATISRSDVNYEVKRPTQYLKMTYSRRRLSSIPLPRLGDNWQPTPEWGKLVSAVEVLWSLRRAATAERH